MSTTIDCEICGDAATKAGRAVRKTDVYEYPLCSLCESRMRNGLLHYQPSNGTEFMIFEERCESCRHYKGFSFEGKVECAWGVLDKLNRGMFEKRDSSKFWFDPADLKTHDGDRPMCPAECLRFTHRNDGDGEWRDPPKPDCEGQMFFDDINVPVERVPVMEEAR